MIVTKAVIHGRNIRDWSSFHDEFNRVFGFPDFYGRNMNAWIDCLTSLDSEQDGMTRIHVQRGSVLTLEITNAGDLKKRCPEMYEAIVQCAAFVNWRRVEVGAQSLLAVSFHIE
jgi:RNAse (barnase) inhibitor barstar